MYNKMYEFTLEQLSDELSMDDFWVEKQLYDCNIVSFFNERFSCKYPNSTSPKKMLIYGHSHSLWEASAGEGKIIINPGSVSLRFEGLQELKGAEYMVIDDGNISLRHIDYAIPKLRDIASCFSDPGQTIYAKLTFGDN